MGLVSSIIHKYAVSAALTSALAVGGVAQAQAVEEPAAQSIDRAANTQKMVDCIKSEFLPAAENHYNGIAESPDYTPSWKRVLVQSPTTLQDPFTVIYLKCEDETFGPAFKHTKRETPDADKYVDRDAVSKEVVSWLRSSAPALDVLKKAAMQKIQEQEDAATAENAAIEKMAPRM